MSIKKKNGVGNWTQKQTWLQDIFSFLSRGLDWFDGLIKPWINGERFHPNLPGQITRPYSSLDPHADAAAQIAAEEAYKTNLARVQAEAGAKGGGLDAAANATRAFNGAAQNPNDDRSTAIGFGLNLGTKNG